jgi:hypothetical protein
VFADDYVMPGDWSGDVVFSHHGVAACLPELVHSRQRQVERLRRKPGLLIIVLSIHVPVTTIVLTRAALFRQRRAVDDLPRPLGEAS